MNLVYKTLILFSVFVLTLASLSCKPKCALECIKQSKCPVSCKMIDDEPSCMCVPCSEQKLQRYINVSPKNRPTLLALILRLDSSSEENDVYADELDGCNNTQCSMACINRKCSSGHCTITDACVCTGCR